MSHPYVLYRPQPSRARSPPNHKPHKIESVNIAVQCRLDGTVDDLKQQLQNQKKVLTSKLENLYFDHKKEMQIYRFAENERAMKKSFSLRKLDEDTEVAGGKIKFDHIEVHIFEELSAFDLNSEVRGIIKAQIE